MMSTWHLVWNHTSIVCSDLYSCLAAAALRLQWAGVDGFLTSVREKFDQRLRPERILYEIWWLVLLLFLWSVGRYVVDHNDGDPRAVRICPCRLWYGTQLVDFGRSLRLRRGSRHHEVLRRG